MDNVRAAVRKVEYEVDGPHAGGHVVAWRRTANRWYAPTAGRDYPSRREAEQAEARATGRRGAWALKTAVGDWVVVDAWGLMLQHLGRFAAKREAEAAAREERARLEREVR